jgi:hypothetical protein
MKRFFMGGVFMFRFFNYYRLLGIILFLSGLHFTFRTGDIVILKYVGLFLMFVGGYDIITGKNMKIATAIKTPMPEKTITDNSKDTVMTNKKIIGKLLKANTIIGVATLAIAIIFFMSSGFIAKKIFNYSDVKNNFNYSSALTSDVPANATSVVKYKNCSKLLLNDKVIIRVNSLESNSKNSSLNITIENNGPSDIQLIGSNKFELVDESGNHFKFKQEDSIGVYNSANKSATTDYRLVFEPLSNPSKSISFKGQIWTMNGGVQDLPFSIDIK